MDTSILPPIFPSITLFRRQFICKLFPILLAFLLFVVCRIFLSSLTLCDTSLFLIWLDQLISFLLQPHISKLSRYFCSAFQNVQDSAPYRAMLHMEHVTHFFFKFKPNLLVKSFFFFFYGAFAVTILDLIPFVHLASFVIVLPKYMKYSTFSTCFWSIIIYNVDNCNEVLISLIFLTFIYIP